MTKLTVDKETIEQAIEALATADNIALVGVAYSPKSIDAGLLKIRNASAILRAALAEPAVEQEPVTHRQGCDALGGYGHGVGPCSCGAVPQAPEPAPVPLLTPGDVALMWVAESFDTSPPPPAEVPLLTDEEIDFAIGFIGSLGSRVDARLIEQAVRQKAGLK